jgi:hypothetical protein
LRRDVAHAKRPAAGSLERHGDALRLQAQTIPQASSLLPETPAAPDYTLQILGIDMQHAQHMTTQRTRREIRLEFGDQRQKLKRHDEAGATALYRTIL